LVGFFFNVDNGAQVMCFSLSVLDTQKIYFVHYLEPTLFIFKYCKVLLFASDIKTARVWQAFVIRRFLKVGTN
jgi:hypothetical protein